VWADAERAGAGRWLVGADPASGTAYSDARTAARLNYSLRYSSVGLHPTSGEVSTGTAQHSAATATRSGELIGYLALFVTSKSK